MGDKVFEDIFEFFENLGGGIKDEFEEFEQHDSTYEKMKENFYSSRNTLRERYNDLYTNELDFIDTSYNYESSVFWILLIVAFLVLLCGFCKMCNETSDEKNSNHKLESGQQAEFRPPKFSA